MHKSMDKHKYGTDTEFNSIEPPTPAVIFKWLQRQLVATGMLKKKHTENYTGRYETRIALNEIYMVPKKEDSAEEENVRVM